MTILAEFLHYGKVSEIFRQVIEKTRLRDELRNNQNERRQKIDLYAFQIDEIDKAQLKVGEVEELEKERNILSNAEKIYGTVTSCYAQLYESSESVVERLKSVVKELQSVAKLDEALQKIFDVCSQSHYQTEDGPPFPGKI